MTFEKKKYEQSLEKGERVSQTNILGKHNPNRGSGLCECPNVSMLGKCREASGLNGVSPGIA